MKITTPRDEGDNHNHEGDSEYPHNEFTFEVIFWHTIKIDWLKSGSNRRIVGVFASFDLFGVIHDKKDSEYEHGNKYEHLNPEDVAELNVSGSRGNTSRKWVDRGS